MRFTPLSHAPVLAIALLALHAEAVSEPASVVFIHPDGAGVAHWGAARMFLKGPDGDLNWDRLPHIAIYRGHMSDSVTATSNGGATVHAYGVKTPADAFGSVGGTSAERPTAASSQKESIMHEALRRGLRTALINSGSIIEPGTAAFVASVTGRGESEEVAKQVVQSGVHLILSGGEEWMLPEGVQGKHGPGKRTDKLDLIAWAKKAGYAVVYDRDAVRALPPTTEKVLGVFAAGHTFHDMPAGQLRAMGLATFKESAPTIAEMTAKALELMGDRQFFMVVEEEGADNFGNCNNARGTLDALARADEAFGVVLDHIAKRPDTFLVTAADSEAGNMDVIGLPPGERGKLMAMLGRDPNAAPYDTYEPGTPILSAPDRAGKRHPFVISWGTRNDSSGGIVVRAAGSGAERVRGTYDNTDVYRAMREALFGENP